MASKPLPDQEFRDALAKNNIHIRNFEVAPKSLNRLTASPDELRGHGIPPKPNKTTHPHNRAKWEDHISRPLRMVQPILGQGPRSLVEPSQRPPRQTGQGFTANPTGWPWSGAVLNARAGQFLDSVSASWIVPNVQPPASAWNGTTLKDGLWRIDAWVGIDGTLAQGTVDVVQAGTTSIVTVTGGGLFIPQVVTHRTFVWIEWWPRSDAIITNFAVSPGDTISVSVCLPSDSTTHAAATIVNLTTNESTIVGFDVPPSTDPAHPHKNETKGTTAEWIIEDAYTTATTSGHYDFPDYGTTFFYDLAAGDKHGNIDLTGKLVLNDMIRPSDNVNLSHASLVGGTNVLMFQSLLPGATRRVDPVVVQQ